MKGKQPMTLAEMAAQPAGSGGRLICPRCGCPDFKTYKTDQGHVQTFRYKACRHCGHRIVTRQQPEEFIRPVETRDKNENGNGHGEPDQDDDPIV